MKRKVIAVLALASIMSVGCSKEENIEVKPTKYINEEEANKIVLDDVPNGKIVEFSLDENDVKPNYEVSVSDGETIHEYEIDAVTGDILKKETKKEDSNTNQEDLISEEKAKSIALEMIPNGKVLKISLDADDNIVNYDVTISDDEYEYEYEIDAKDGTIIAESKEKINK